MSNDIQLTRRIRGVDNFKYSLLQYDKLLELEVSENDMDKYVDIVMYFLQFPLYKQCELSVDLHRAKIHMFDREVCRFLNLMSVCYGMDTYIVGYVYRFISTAPEDFIVYLVNLVNTIRDRKQKKKKNERSI